MGHSSLEATEPSEARVWKGEPKSFLGEVDRSEKHGMVFAGLGRMVGLPDESLTARIYSTMAVQTASGSPALNLTAHRASQTIKTSLRTIFSTQSNGSPRPHVPQTPTIRKGNQTRLRFDPGARKLATPQPARPLTPLPKTQTAASNQAQT